MHNISRHLAQSIKHLEERRTQSIELQQEKDTKKHLFEEDIVRILDNTRDFILTKNQDETLQKIYFEHKISSASGKRISQEINLLHDLSLSELTQYRFETVYHVFAKLIKEICSDHDFRRIWKVAIELLSTIMCLPRDTHPEIKKKYANDFIMLLQKAARHPNYVKALNGVFFITDFARDVSRSSLSGTKYKFAPKEERMFQALKEIIARFTGQGSVDLLIDIMKNFWRDEDLATENWFIQMKSLIRDSLRHPSLLGLEERRREIEALLASANEVIDEKWLPYLKEVWSQLQVMLDNACDDPFFHRLRDNIRKLLLDLAITSDGTLSLGYLVDSLSNFKRTLWPAIIGYFRRVQYIAFEESGPKLDYSIKTKGFDANAFLPERCICFLSTQSVMEVKRKGDDHTDAILTLELKEFTTKFEDVHFSYKKKVFPRSEDEGIADCGLGKGMDLKIVWSISTSKPLYPPRFFVEEVRCDLDTVTVKVKHSKHRIVDNIISHKISKHLKHVTKTSIERQLKVFAQLIADCLNDGLKNIKEHSTPYYPS